MHQALQGATFHLEHVLPTSLGGQTDLENLALACPSCNLHKANRIAAIDPETGALVRLFNPRQDIWRQHFKFDLQRLSSQTTIGRATIAALDLNAPRRLQIRSAETSLGFEE